MIKKFLVLIFILSFTVSSYGVALWRSGAEQNSIKEFSEQNLQAITGAAKRSGSYGFQIASAESPTTSYLIHYFNSANQSADYYARMYIYISAFLSVTESPILTFKNVSDANKISVRMKTDHTLILYNEEDGAQIGSASAPLDAKKWYQIELRTNTTTLASTVVAAKIDTVTFASGTVNLVTGIGRVAFGILTSTRVDMFWDDLALNDGTGSFQNSWPGYGRIVHLNPRAAGSVNSWRHKDGTAGSSTNYQEVDETTPDDASTYVKSRSVANDTDFYAIDSFTTLVDSFVEINVLQMGLRFADSLGVANSDTIAGLIKLKGGVPEQGSDIQPVSTTWRTNDPSGNEVLNYTLTLYDLPGASVTKFTGKMLDTTQIGIISHKIASATPTYVSTTWLLVEYGYRKVNYLLKAEKDNSGSDLGVGSSPENYGQDTVLWVGEDGATALWRGIVWFNIPSLAPGTFEVDSCFLLAYFEDELAVTNRDIRVAGMVTNPQNLDWLEGDGTLLGSYTFGSSWDSTGRPDTAWTAAGFAPGRNLDTLSFATPNNWMKFTIPVTWITAMINGESTFTGFVFINNSEGTANSQKMIASLQAGSLKACSLKIYDAQDDFATSSPGTSIIWQAPNGGTVFNNSGDGLFSQYQTHGWAVTNNNIFVTWNNSPFSTGCDGIVYSKSTDGGATWTAPTCLFETNVSDATWRTSITSDGVGDTLFIIISRGQSNVTTPDTIVVIVFSFAGGVKDTITLPKISATNFRTGNRADIEWESGDVFWATYGKGFDAGTGANDTMLTITKYSTDRCRSWTLSDSILTIGNFGSSANAAMACHDLIHTDNSRMVLVYTRSTTTVGSPAIRHRRDSWAKGTWVITGNVANTDGRWGGSYPVKGGSNDVAVIYPLSNNIEMKKWYDADSSIQATADVVFRANLGATADNIADCFAIGDSFLIFAQDEQMATNSQGADTVPNPNNYQRVPMYRLTTDTGATFSDSVGFTGLGEEYHFSKVWIDRNGTFKDLTDSVTSSVSTTNKWQMFGALTDTMYYGSSFPFKRIQWYLDTRGTSSVVKSFKYWDGDSWEEMSVYKSYPDGAVNLWQGTNVYHWVEFDSIPSAWTTNSVNGTSKYWIKVSVGTAFTTTPKGRFTTPGSYNTTGGFIGNLTNKFAIMYIRGAQTTTGNNQVRFAKLDLTAAPAGGAVKREGVKMMQIFHKPEGGK